LIQTDGGVSLFRNLYIDNKTRNPKVKGVNEFTNNVVYNWGGGGGYIAGDSDGQSCMDLFLISMASANCQMPISLAITLSVVLPHR
jgi:hypothetical protein